MKKIKLGKANTGFNITEVNGKPTLQLYKLYKNENRKIGDQFSPQDVRELMAEISVNDEDAYNVLLYFVLSLGKRLALKVTGDSGISLWRSMVSSFFNLTNKPKMNEEETEILETILDDTYDACIDFFKNVTEGKEIEEGDKDEEEDDRELTEEEIALIEKELNDLTDEVAVTLEDNKFYEDFKEINLNLMKQFAEKDYGISEENFKYIVEEELKDELDNSFIRATAMLSMAHTELVNEWGKKFEEMGKLVTEDFILDNELKELITTFDGDVTGKFQHIISAKKALSGKIIAVQRKAGRDTITVYEIDPINGNYSYLVTPLEK